MNYNEAMEYIHGSLKFGSVLGLARIKKLMELLGNPQDSLKVIHVGGTNGKGSTSSFISQILIESGYKTGLFTSPYLESFTERIRIDGRDIGKDELAKAATAVKRCADKLIALGYEHPTEFEIVTAIAFYYYWEKQVDFVVLEVGLGGRCDATNIIEKPLISVITPIEMDHMDVLGDTLGKIAMEKAGIIKKGCPVVLHPQQKEAMDAIRKAAEDNNAKLVVADTSKKQLKSSTLTGQVFDYQINSHLFEDIGISLLGKHQVNNAIVAINAIWQLNEEHGYFIDKRAIYEGLKKATWPGRLEVLSNKPLILIDGAHNYHGAMALSRFIEDNFPKERVTLVLGMLKDKEVDKVLRELIPKAGRVVTTSPDNPRAMDSDELLHRIKLIDNKIRILASHNSIKKALHEAVEESGPEDVIIFAGSLYMIGAVRSLLKKNKND